MKKIAIYLSLAVVTIFTLVSCTSVHTKQGQGFPRVDVIIVGAGMAGLTAAKELAKSSKTYVVLEAQDRIGGRAISDLSFSVPIDLGACWLHGVDENPLVQVVDERGFSRVDTELNGPIYMKDHWASKAEHAVCDQAEEKFAAALEKSVASNDDPPASQLLADGPCSDLVASNVGPFEAGAELNEISSKASAMFLAGNDDILRESIGKFVEDYGRDVPVKLNSIVTRIAYDNEGVQVSLRSGEVFHARRVLVTVSNGVLLSGAIEFSPTLPEWKTNAIKSMPMGLMNKVIIQFKKDIFGDTPKNSWVLFDAPDTENLAFLISPLNAPIAVGFLAGDIAKRLENNDEQALKKILDALRQMYGKKVDENLERYAITHFGEESWTKGSYSYITPGAINAHREILRPVSDRVFFAGEASAKPEFSGSIHGAYQSALEASASLLASLARGDVEKEVASFPRPFIFSSSTRDLDVIP